MSQLQVFNYQGFAVDFELIDGELYANATAMCRPFDKTPYEWARLPNTIRYAEALKANRENPVSLTISRKGGPTGGSTWIHEKLILKLAQWLDVDFEIWCDSRIAELLRTGKTQLTPAPYYLPQTKAEALRALAEEIEAHEATQLQLEAVQPKVEQYERTMNAEGSFTVGEVAKMIGTGQNRLFDFLRQQNVLFYHRGHNQPYQQYVDSGWFSVRQKTFQHGDKPESYPQLFVLPKGVEGIRKKWDAAHQPAPALPAPYQPQLVAEA